MTEAIDIAGIVFGSVRPIYWLAAAIVLILAMWLPKIRWQKVAAAAATVAVFSYLPAKQILETLEVVQYRKAAWAHFEKRCRERAGEKIHKTAENVESIFLMKPRPKATHDQLRDQNWMGDPYGYQENDLMIQDYLWGLNERGGSSTAETPRKGFRYVESAGKTKEEPFLRYTLDRKAQKLVQEIVTHRASAYGVTWQDISTPEDRSYWVAGGKFQVVDLRTNEIIAERTGYLIETGFGSRGQGGGREAWEAARVTGSACPPIPRNVSIDRTFVEKVLKPSVEVPHAK